MAKQFLANRSGQTPTLDEVPNETIKIYPTEAALDADLANLEENEIVATDEDNDPASGTQYPVDVVQEGNMSAVTSNAVAENLSYSTTEQKTGGTWIDGKPIYRKIVDCGALPNNTSKSVAHNISNLGQVVSLRGIASKSTLQIIPLPYVYPPDASYNVGMFVYDDDIRFETRANVSSYIYTYAIIEYTKTTD